MGRFDTARGFLGRLKRDVRGNTIAIMAAAMIPLAGMIGGGVDMSRLYLTKTRLQQACDAGALAGRKAMGSDDWTTGVNNGSTNDQAERMFGANFGSGQYGTTALTKEFTEDDGTINGAASATVPMSIMKIFGMQPRTIHVNCTAKMEIPNTDVMFVLDVTGSMSSSGKIQGLRSAVLCFYEALQRVNTAEVCGNDPTATTSTITAQIRLGFVPYDENVNVGKILNNDFLANNWTYDSRAATTTTVYAWTLGTPVPPANWNAYAWVGTIPDSFSDPSGYGTFAVVSGANTVMTAMVDGNSFVKLASAVTTAANCAALNQYGSFDQLVGVQENATPGTPGTPTYAATDNDPPVHPATVQNNTATRTRSITVTYGFRYRWFKNPSTAANNACWLERAGKTSASNANKYTQTQTGPATKPITWTPYSKIDKWTYGPVSHNVAALKAGGSSWSGSVALPIAQANSPSVKLSESNTAGTFKVVSNTNVTWSGCIEERQTYQNSNGFPENDWSPVPSSAYDMDLNMIPSDALANSHWGPLLGGAVWERYAPTGVNCNLSSTRNQGPLESACDFPKNFGGLNCPTAEARKLAQYNTASGLESYVASLTPGGNTYHDIGMIWGARLLSPLGIYAGENAFTPAGLPIRRHLIFMTDGDTNVKSNEYSAYGINYYSRRQVSYDASDTQMNNMTDARLAALCSAVRNMNIELWVIGYGTSIAPATETRLRNCASPGKYYAASAGPALISRFRQIASEISELRLTN